MKSATELVIIKTETQYPEVGKMPFHAIHCLKSNTKDILLSTDSSFNITFPPGSFIKGAIYPISLTCLHNDGDASFVGYRQGTNSIF